MHFLVNCAVVLLAWMNMIQSLESHVVNHLTDTPCLEGSFQCGEIEKCLLQKFQCDGHPDCPNNFDENRKNCTDLRGGSPAFFRSNPPKTGIKRTEKNGSCELDNVPPTCGCKETRAYCHDIGLTEFPTGIRGNLTKLYLSYNNIPVLSTGICENYTYLAYLYLEHSKVDTIEPFAFRGLQNILRLFLTGNKLGIKGVTENMFAGLDSLFSLELRRNSLKDFDLNGIANYTPKLGILDLSANELELKEIIFPYFAKLHYLSIERNKIKIIKNDTFKNLIALETLNMTNNQITSVHPSSFRSLVYLQDLDLSHNQIRYLDKDIFINNKHLTSLKLGGNPLTIPKGLFDNLIMLRSLDLEGLDINDISVDMFKSSKNLSFIYFKRFHYCRYVPHVRICRPNTDGVSSMENLLTNSLLRSSVWIVGIMCCLGNAVVLMGRLISGEENKVLSIFIRNLAAADFLMGIYLLVIGAHDIAYRKNYNIYADVWMSSWVCAAAGVVAMTSSETSVLIMCFMTMERFVCIVFNPFDAHGLTPQKTHFSMACIWVLGFLIALAPILHWHSSNDFYGSNGTCFPLHIDDPFILGWEYSAFVFLGVNFSSVIVIVTSYTSIFASVQRTRKSTTLVMASDNEFAYRIFFIVLTDCLCWIPIIVIKFMAMANISINADLYAWVVVFILPINSAINPFLYTFTTRKFRSQAGKFKSAILMIVSASLGRKDSMTETVTVSSDLCSFKDGNICRTGLSDRNGFRLTNPTNSLCFAVDEEITEINTVEEKI